MVEKGKSAIIWFVFFICISNVFAGNKLNDSSLLKGTHILSDTIKNEVNEALNTNFYPTAVNAIISYEDLIKNIENTIVLFGILITVVVAIGAIILPLMASSNSKRMLDQIQSNTFSRIEDLRNEVISTQRNYEKTLDSRFNVEDFKVKVDANFEKFVNNFEERFSDKNVSISVDKHIDELFNKVYREEIARTAISYSKAVFGQTASYMGIQESVLRRFSGQIIRSIDPLDKDMLKNTIENCILDLLVLSKIYGGDEELRIKGLEEYARVHPFKEFQPILREMLNEYNDKPVVYCAILNAISASDLLTE